MALEYNALQILKYKKYYTRFYSIVKDTIYDETTAFLLKAFGEYFEKYNQEVIQIEEFYTFFILTKCKKLTQEQKEAYRCIISQIKKDAPDAVKETFLQRVADLRLANTLSNAIFKYNDGKDIDLEAELQQAQADYKAVCASFSKEDFVQEDIGKLLDEEENDEGIKFRCGCLNRHMKPLRAGEFGIIAARPDAGKTTFILSEITYMAKQLPADKNVVIFNNEGNGSQIFLRLRQAALGCTIQQLIEKKKAGTLEQEYIDAVGREDKIRIINIHDMNTAALDRLMVKHNVGLVVYDMLDNVNISWSGEKTHERLEAIYKWARIQQTKHNSIGIATSQVSAEGEGMLYPTQSMLKDSKTGKQGACDFIIILGKNSDVQFDGIRYIGIPKNKKRRAGVKSNPRAEVMFNPDICRVNDETDTEEDNV